MEAGRRKDNKPGIKRLVSVRLCLRDWFLGGGGGTVMMHCIALHHSRAVQLTHTHIHHLTMACVSLHHGPFLAPFATPRILAFCVPGCRTECCTVTT